MDKTCVVCGGKYEAVRDSSMYCTPGCRKLAFQRGRVSVLGEGVSVPLGPLSVPENGVSVPKNLSVPVENGVSVLSVPGFIDPNDPKVIEEGLNISDEKKREMSSTKLPEVTLDTPCFTGVAKENPDEVFLDVEKDLGLDLKKDLGIFAWSKDGIFIRPDITVKQVQNIARLIHAKHGRPCPEFRECV